MRLTNNLYDGRVIRERSVWHWIVFGIIHTQLPFVVVKHLFTPLRRKGGDIPLEEMEYRLLFRLKIFHIWRPQNFRDFRPPPVRTWDGSTVLNSRNPLSADVIYGCPLTQLGAHGKRRNSTHRLWRNRRKHMICYNLYYRLLLLCNNLKYKVQYNRSVL